jgi:hypothetical protein
VRFVTSERVGECQTCRLDRPAAVTTAPISSYRSVGEIDAFVDLLRAACEDESMNAALRRLLGLPSRRRKAFVRAWAAELAARDAPRSLAEAIACLVDDAVAGKAREVINGCSGSR